MRLASAEMPHELPNRAWDSPADRIRGMMSVRLMHQPVIVERFAEWIPTARAKR